MPGGRPTLMHAPDGEDAQGHPITKAQRVIELIGRGIPQNETCRAVGVAVATIQLWMRNGAAARQKAESGYVITVREAEYLAFLNDYESAAPSQEAARIAVIERAAFLPQITKRIVVKKEAREITHADGSRTWELTEVERTETIEEKPPQWAAAAWLEERTRPERWGRRMAVDVAPSQGSQEDRARSLSDSVEEFLRSKAEDEGAPRELGPAPVSPAE